MRLIHVFASSKHFSTWAISQSVFSPSQHVLFDADEDAGECGADEDVYEYGAGESRTNSIDLDENEAADSMLDPFSLSSKVQADSELVSALENVIINLRLWYTLMKEKSEYISEK